jgi:hypothetical protein
MKTKIIYISGNEIFEMAQIRAAFDEVRNALGLDKDTILFGVPVDEDNAIQSETCTDSIEETVCVAEPETETTTENIIITDECYIEPGIIDDTDNVFIEQEIVLDESDETEPEISEPECEDIDDNTPATETIETSETDIPSESSEKIIPILSVLGGKSVTANEEPKQETIITTETISITNIDETEDMVVVNNIEITGTDENIADMINEDTPVVNTEKTLEQLLESMTPLCEDIMPHTDTPETDISDDIDMDIAPAIDDTDATLAQLASEFVETEDKIVDEPKTSSYGKIGKLKNILPFKKAKRDDGGLMGDLFGWAGIAANDDDFSMPGFFTKKQGA